MVTPEEREWMWEQFAVDPRMRLNLGIRRRLAPLLDNDRRKIDLIYSLLFTLPGSPIIYYGDEIGMGDDISLPDRNGVRTAMQWNSDLNAGFSDGPEQDLFSPIISDDIFGSRVVNVYNQQRDPASLWNTIRKMLLARKQHRSFGLGGIEWMDCQNDRIAVFCRQFKEENVWAVHNLNDSKEVITLKSSNPEVFHELLTDKLYKKQGNQLLLELEPYQFLWLKEKSANE
jgi:maltose alpha-D-glucosyltransferase/alpha-amylase